MVWQYLWLIPLGVILGAVGTLIGAGGGFVLMPILLLLYPKEQPEILTSISLAVVFFNALSGSYAYGKMKRIDYRSMLLFSAASIPGAVLGALTTSMVPRWLFDVLLGVLMVGASIFLALRPLKEGARSAAPSRSCPERTIEDSKGVVHRYSYNPVLGAALSFVVGYVSSLLGLGGGIIHVPLMVNVLSFPVHIATATSHSVLAVTALAGTVAHIVAGEFSHGVRRTVCLALGVIIGAQLGAHLSCRLRGTWILRGLALALCLVGIRILHTALTSHGP